MRDRPWPSASRIVYARRARYPRRECSTFGSIGLPSSRRSSRCSSPRSRSPTVRRPRRPPLAADAFDGERAFGGRAPLRNSLAELGRAFPRPRPARRRTPRSPTASPRRSAPPDRTGRPAFASRASATATSRPWSACGRASRAAGSSSLSHRDALESPGPRRAVRDRRAARAGARVPRARAAQDARARLHLAAPRTDSRARARGRAATTGGRSTRCSCSATWRARARTQAVGRAVVARPRPGAAGAPAHRRERACASRPAAPGGSRATAQWVRRALPLHRLRAGRSIAEASLPAVMMGVSGERGPEPGARCARRRLERFGRAALRAVTAIDAAGPAQDDGGGRPSPGARRDRHDAQRAARLGGAPARRHAAAARLPDRARRLLPRPPPPPRRSGRGWSGSRVGAARAAGVGVGARARPDRARWSRPRRPCSRCRTLERGGAVALGSVAFVARARLVRRPPAAARARRRARQPGRGRGWPRPRAPSCAAAAVVWAANPYAAALLLPAAHLWLFAAAPQTRLRRWWGVAAIVAGLLPFGFVALYYTRALGLDPLELAWMTLLPARLRAAVDRGGRRRRRRCSPASRR